MPVETLIDIDLSKLDKKEKTMLTYLKTADSSVGNKDLSLWMKVSRGEAGRIRRSLVTKLNIKKGF